MTSSYRNPNTGETTSVDYNSFGTTEGEVRFGDTTENDTKMAVMIRRIFPHSFSPLMLPTIQETTYASCH